ncbi:unnamed protein product, partial [Mesorhabditis spiculigera]
MLERANITRADEVIDFSKLEPWVGMLPGNINREGQAVNLTGQQLQDDGVWIITSSFTIFTMTSGFGLLESGRVSSKDEVNIMVKNVIDVIFGGLYVVRSPT